MNQKPEEPNEEQDNELYYFNRDEQMYKVFDPDTKTWSSQAEKPSEEQLEEIRSM